MSVLKTVEAVPSRVAGVFRFILSSDREGVSRGQLERLLSPETILTDSGRDMVKKVISECQKMRLLAEVDRNGNKVIALSDGASSMYPELVFELPLFRMLIVKLVIGKDREENENRDLCDVLAWFLAQNTYTIGSGYENFNELLRHQAGVSRLGLTNEAMYDQFRYWSVFLGFAGVHGNRRTRKHHLIPDATGFLSNHLAALYEHEDSDQLPMVEMLDRLTSICPLLKGGQFHGNISHFLPEEAPEYIPVSLSHALLRLQDRKILELLTIADHDGRILNVPDQRDKVTHVRLLLSRRH